MSISDKYLPGILKALILIMLIPALFINLGIMPFILDEGTRGLVALEMLFSGNYIVPTINGEFYYNKPPLFNWILIGFVKLSGSYSEFVFRLPVVLSLIGFALTVFFSLKKELGREVAFITSIALITCGRIFFYDSFKGLIDISFSWLTYTGFYLIYYFNKRGELFKLFFISWLITALGFLLKGLPSLVFQGITLLTFFIYTKQFSRLFSLKHIISFLFFILIIGSYFLLYHQFNSLDNYWNALWSESTKRTLIESSTWNTLLHLFTFPGEFIMHFLPWTLLIVFLIGKNRLPEMYSIPLVRFFIFIFSANILIYWLSPEIYPRYLFMFLPLLFGTGAYAWIKYGKETLAERYIWHPMMMVFGVSVTGILIALPFTSHADHFSHLSFIWVFLLFISVVLTLIIVTQTKFRVYIFIMILIVSRIAFNIFVLPDRVITDFSDLQKKGVIEAARISGNRKVYLYKDCPIHHTSSFYFTAEKKEVLSRWYDEPEKDVYYLVKYQDLINHENAEVLHSFETGSSRTQLALIRFIR